MATCFNKSLPEYQELKSVYGKDLIVDAVIESYQKLTGTDEYPSVDQVRDMMDSATVEKVMDSNKANLIRLASQESLNQAQRDVVQEIAEFHLEVDFEEETHTYRSALSKDVLSSTTTLIKGEMKDEQGEYAINRRIGNAFDRMLQAYLEGKDPTKVSFTFREDGKDVTLNVSPEFKAEMAAFIETVAAELAQEGSVLIPQVVVSSLEGKVAGSIDILVVKPNGEIEVLDLKSSKNSINGVYKGKDGKTYKSYDRGYQLAKSEVDEETGEIKYQGSKLADQEVNGEGKPVYLSTRQQHMMQVGIYARMLMNRGFTVARTATYHILYTMDEGKTTLTGFESEGYSEHSPETDMRTFADVILPLEETTDPVDVSGELSREMGEEGKGEFDDEGPQIDNFQLAVLLQEGIMLPLQRRLKSLQDLYDRRANITDPRRNLFVPKAHETIDALADLLYMIEKEGKTGKALLAYGRYINHATEEIQDFIDFVSNPANLQREVTAGVLENFAKFIKTYSEINDKSAKINSVLPKEQRKLLDKLAVKIEEGKEHYEAARMDWLINMVKNTTSQPLTDDEIRQQLQQAEDISSADGFAGDMSTSTDLILRVIDKLYKRQDIQAADAARRFSTEIDNAVEDLVRLSPGGKVDYSFMYEDHNGDLRILSKYGPAYEKKREELKARLYDSQGKYLEYKEISDTSRAKPEDIEYNKRLFEARQEYADFLKGELVENGKAVEGNHHRYTDAFQQERRKFEIFNGKRWVKRIDVSDSAYRRYRNKYYNVLSDILVPVKTKDGKTTGATRRVTIEVVDRKYIEPRERAADGTNYLNDKYEKLMNSTSELGKAQKKFYEFYVNSWEKGRLNTLPKDYGNYLKGSVPVLQDQIRKFSHLPVPLRVLARWVMNLKDFLFDWNLPVPEVRRQSVDENGNIVSSIPLFIQGKRGAAAQEKIDKLNEEIEALRERLREKKIDFREYKRIKTDLRDQKRRLERMPSKVDPEVDIARAMKVQNAQIENYEKMTAIEDIFTVMKAQVLERQYYSRKQAKLGGEEEMEFMQPQASRTIKRMERWFKMTYNKENYFDNMSGYQKILEVGAKKLLQGSSLLYVGLNPWANASNYIWGRISTGMETAGGLYYERRAMMKAVKLYNSEYLPGRARAIGDGFTPELKMRTERYHSKYEALLTTYNMARQMLAGEDRAETGFLGAYFLQDAAEINVQSKTGMAMVLSTRVVDPTGTEMSLYDAYEWDSEAGKLEFPKGDWKIIKARPDGSEYQVKWDENEKAYLQNKIYEVNKQMHGNYAREDRAAMQDSTVGAMAMQFHKWFYPAWKAHFKRRYYDENLGWYEGRAISLYNFLTSIISYGSIADARAELDDLSKGNIRKAAYELGVFATTLLMATVLASIKKGIDDDDEESKEFVRILNQLAFLNDRLGGEATFFYNPTEMTTMVSNPFASSRYLQNIVEALVSSYHYGVYSLTQDGEELLDNKNVYYQRGSRAGTLKVAKEWRDVLPALYTINRWLAFETVNKDYRAN